MMQVKRKFSTDRIAELYTYGVCGRYDNNKGFFFLIFIKVLTFMPGRIQRIVDPRQWR